MVGVLVLGASVLLLALGVFGAHWHQVEEVGSAERDGYVAKAEELLDGRIPRDPFRPLLYPLLTAGLARLGIPPFTAARWISNAAAVALVLLAWGFGRRLGRRRGGGTALGAWAALATAVNPNVWILGQHVTTDMLFAALAGGVLLTAFAYLERPRAATAALGGLLYGAAAFTRGNAGFLLPGVLAAALLAWRRAPSGPPEDGSEDERQGVQRTRWMHGVLAVLAGVAVLLPHWLLRTAAFGDPFHDENWKNLAWKLHGHPDWSYLDRVPFDGLWDVVVSSPGALLRGGISEVGRFFFGGGLSQLLGTPLHALLLVIGIWAAWRVRPRATGWLLFAGGVFLVALAFAFFTWGRLLLVLLPPANALAFAALSGEPGRSLRRRISEGLGGLPRWGLRLRSGLPRLAVVGAGGLVAVLAVKTFFFRIPAFIERHPTIEIAVLRQFEEELPRGASLAGVTPFLGRYLDAPYLTLPDAFGTEIEQPERWFAKVRPLLADADARFLVVGAQDLRDRPESLLGPGSPVPWLEPVSRPDAFGGDVAVWRVE